MWGCRDVGDYIPTSNIQHPNIPTSQHPNIPTSPHPNIPTSQHPHIPTSSMSDPLIRDISDTARWVAYYRAQETDRPDAVFRDPYARALAGERGERIAKAQSFTDAV